MQQANDFGELTNRNEESHVRVYGSIVPGGPVGPRVGS